MSLLLTDQELITLTGAKQPKRQIKTLRENNIPHIVRIDGKPVVTWEMVNSKAIRQKTEQSEIDTSWMN